MITYIVPMELQKLNPATEPPRSLSDGLQDILCGHRLADRTKQAPLGRGNDCIPHVGR